ncbi:o-succinylbenzoate synthase [Phototrophicus methaneseepsis]|uniref:o-succinylbenzoate synthase n=1 Tax=Phototrophicus methaneseepsis TaxID=2710758 RepID=A0A7S8E6W9_9CHLR|nr:o-succinylbenzoate synthase [Phototrophicus methaneseepsis]QPC81476.1 o-succinylbenzoate synthase [Phototrophicus methaneseepsis]
MRPITIKSINLYPISMPFVEPLKTSFGMEPFKGAVLVEVITEDGVSGWGESAVAPQPGYSGETVATAYHIIRHFMAPLLTGKTISDPYQARSILKVVRDHHHARAGIEGAVWDAFAKANDMRLTDLFASYTNDSSTNRVVVGVSIGIQPSVEDTLKIIRKRLGQGYQRIKLKIKRGWDVDFAREIRQALPDTTIMLDANSAYTLADADHLAQLDELNLLMIEQPLQPFDIYEHGLLNHHLETPICLDESVRTSNDLRIALQVNAIDILNLKPARVGGYAESLDMYAICVEHELPLWIGGMLETGIGRAANIAFAALPGVTLPSDISATDRYFATDIAEPAFVLAEGSTLTVPDGPGIGVEVVRERIEEAAARWEEHHLYPIG